MNIELTTDRITNFIACLNAKRKVKTEQPLKVINLIMKDVAAKVGHPYEDMPKPCNEKEIEESTLTRLLEVIVLSEQTEIKEDKNLLNQMAKQLTQDLGYQYPE